MKLLDIAKGLFKTITAPKPPKITQHPQQRTRRPEETQLHKAPAHPTGRPQRTPRTTAPKPQHSVRPASSESAPRPRTVVENEHIRKGSPKHPWPRSERKVSQDNPVKKQIKRFWEKLKPTEKPKKESEPKQRQPGKRRQQVPTAPAQPKRRGRPLGAKDKQPRKPRTTAPTPVDLPNIPTDLAPDEQEPANGAFNIIAWLESQISISVNPATAAYLMSLIYDVINAEGEVAFCERIKLEAVESDVEVVVYEESDGDRIFFSFMQLASLIGLSVDLEYLHDCIMIYDGRWLNSKQW